MIALTVAVLDYVREEIVQFGAAPTIQEIADAQRISKTKAHRVVSQLVADKLLVRARDRTRGLALPNVPDLRPVSTDWLRGELARRGETFDALAIPKPLRFEGRPCAATTCGEHVGMGRLFCGRHWSALPRDLRDAVLAAFWAKDADRYRELVRRAVDLADGFGGVDRQVAA